MQVKGNRLGGLGLLDDNLDVRTHHVVASQQGDEIRGRDVLAVNALKHIWAQMSGRAAAEMSARQTRSRPITRVHHRRKRIQQQECITSRRSPFSMRFPSFDGLNAGPPGTTIATAVFSNTMPTVERTVLVLPPSEIACFLRSASIGPGIDIATQWRSSCPVVLCSAIFGKTVLKAGQEKSNRGSTR